MKPCECGKTHNGKEVFYVTVKKGANYRFLAGPYATHAEALGQVQKATGIVYQMDANAPWYAYGTAGMEKAGDNPTGLFNEQMEAA